MDTGTSADREVQRTLIQLLAELDGFDTHSEVRIVAATNRVDIIDPALLRPGRFDRIVEIPLPDEKGRLEIFKIHTRRMSIDKDVDLQELAARAVEHSGADIKAICTEAGMLAIRELRKKVSMADFQAAMRKHGKGDLRQGWSEGPAKVGMFA